MTIYKINHEEVDTELALGSWPDVITNTQSGYVSKSTGSSSHRETLYRTQRGRFYVVHKSSFLNHPDWAEWMSPEHAAKFFIVNNYPLPDFLSGFKHSVRYSVPMKAIEVAQQLADFVSDVCKQCSIWSSQAQFDTPPLNLKPPRPCPRDFVIEECLKADKPGTHTKHNYCVDKNYSPTDFRHWKVAERISEDELFSQLRKNT